MILTGPRIQEEVSKGTISIHPFTPSQINPNSYDFRLHNTLVTYTEPTLDVSLNNPTSSLAIPAEGLCLVPNRVYLGATTEFMGSAHFVPIIRGKSSLARLGLFIHMTADLIDLGDPQRWTLQLHVVQPLKIYPGMLVGQVTFWQPLGERIMYDGKYRGATGPRASESFRDFLPRA